MMLASIQEKVKNLTSNPGVYLFKDAAGRTLYVGKGKNLRKRLQSYCSARGTMSPKMQAMLEKAADLEFVSTATEKEALILESNLIKKHRPRYNVVLRDDKRYLSLRIDPREEYPRLSLVRRMRRDGALYFGPFASAKAIRDTVRVLSRTFPLRQCKGQSFRLRQRPCLNYQMGRCLGLCTGRVSAEEYSRVVAQAIMFLKGRTRELQEKLRQEMQQAAAALEFERAAIYRDRLRAVEKTLEKQRVTTSDYRDRDVIGICQNSAGLALAVLFIRGGRLLGSRTFQFRTLAGSGAEAVQAFIQQYYGPEREMPAELLVGEELEEKELLAEWLSDLKGRPVTIRRPQRGDGRHLVALAEQNAADHLTVAGARGRDDRAALERLRELLGLKTRPRRLECVDISNIQGRYAVGSLVVFQEGEAEKSGYRRYRIRTMAQTDDTAMMAEVLRRHFGGPESGGDLPDLLVLDGGKGQLNQALGVLRELGLEKRVPAAALAKKSSAPGREAAVADRLHLPGRKNPLLLRSEPALLHLLARLRDEAHRFAISYYQRRHRRSALQSRLDRLPGVGRIRKQALLRHFGSLERLRRASVEEIALVPGIGDRLAEAIHASLHPQG